VLFSASRGKGVIHYCGPADELARKVAAEERLPLARLANPESGSLLSYAGVDRGTAVIRIAVSTRSTAQTNWATYKRALLLAIDCADEANVASSEKNESRSPVTAAHPAPSTPVAPKAEAKKPIPVRTVAGKATDAPSTILRYEDLKNGLPVVPVKRPTAATPVKPVAPAPRSQVDYIAPVGDAAILRRLPSVDRIAPTPAVPQHARLPQSPIPLYPDSGYE
jgi:hypothetical protein